MFVEESKTRICPGKNLVISSIWLLLVSMMATLDISKAVDEEGNVVEPKIDFNNPIFRSGTAFPSWCDADEVEFHLGFRIYSSVIYDRGQSRR